MAADRTPKTPREPHSGEPQRHVPDGKGTLKIRVFASDPPDAHDVVRGAWVTVTGPQGPTEQMTFTGETDNAGRPVLEVPAGHWRVTAAAFGQTKPTRPEWHEVRPDCETCVDVTLPIALVVTIASAPELTTSGETSTVRAGTILK